MGDAWRLARGAPLRTIRQMASRSCPQCGSEVERAGNPYRPFCSERCRLVDLAAWLGERYVIAGEPGEIEPVDGSSDGGASDARNPEPSGGGAGARARRMGS